ncbi:phosphoglycolate phosphatase [Azospirillum halopraeferens]|uniref:phosphoglycolate phosphatase n=1 Tax=Azospirillum halopraeferens TaxID=34010 RepID=UPI0004215C21|nr:phosphoglycolate phosphatase [Azospirillum halopraeferens]
MMDREQPEPVIAAVVFDLDGTLVDSAPDIRRAVNTVLEELERPPLDLPTVTRFIGDGAARLVERALEATGGIPGGDAGPHVRRFIALYEADPGATTALFPGAAATLEKLEARGLRLAVCTNKPLTATRRLLADLGIAHRFAAVAGGDSYPTRKPAPEPLLGVLSDLDVPPGDALYVGDNEHDVACARAAGVRRVYLMRHGYARVPLEELPHDGILDGFADLAARLDRASAVP